MTPFQITFTVRGYEVDTSRSTPLPVVFSYLEQVRWAWMTDPSWGLHEHLRRGCFFVVRRQALELLRRPRFGERITVDAAIEDVGRSRVVVRHTLFFDERPVGRARVLGVWLGPDRRLARLPDQARERGRAKARAPTPRPGPLLPEPRFDLRPEHHHRVRVRPSDCDVFGHLNASRWLDLMNDARHRAGYHDPARAAVIDYRREAVAGDALVIAWRRDGATHFFRVERDGEALCAAAVVLDGGLLRSATG